MTCEWSSLILIFLARYLLRRAATRALQLQLPSTSAALRPRPVANLHRAPLLLSNKQWAVLPVQRRFASGETESSSPDQGTSEAQTPTESPHAPPAIDSALPDEAVATQTIPAEETTKVEPAVVEATGSSNLTARAPVESIPMHQELLQDTAAAETAPINETVASAAAAAGSAALKTPSDSIPPNSVLYVGNLYFEVSEDALQEHFAPFGKISRVRIVYDHRGLSKGYGISSLGNALTSFQRVLT